MLPIILLILPEWEQESEQELEWEEHSVQWQTECLIIQADLVKDQMLIILLTKLIKIIPNIPILHNSNQMKHLSLIR